MCLEDSTDAVYCLLGQGLACFGGCFCLHASKIKIRATRVTHARQSVVYLGFGLIDQILKGGKSYHHGLELR
jgi:hypothetical protein